MRNRTLAFLLAFGTAAWAQFPAVTPSPRPDAWWQKRHQDKLTEIRQGPVGLVFVGDSITQNWESPQYQAAWTRYYGSRQALNLGFSGDTTADVLWRLQHGEVEGIQPRAAVVLIGTNNSGIYHGWSADQNAQGVEAVVAELHSRLPLTKILLLGILPSNINEWKSSTDAAVNTQLDARYRYSSYVTFLDISGVFEKDGHIDTTLFGDKPTAALHPSVEGQQKMAEAIEPTLSRLLGK